MFDAVRAFRAPAAPHAPPRRGGRLSAWWRAGAPYAALCGTAAVLLLTAAQVGRGWRARQTAAERALRDHLLGAAMMFSDQVAAVDGLRMRALLWPVLGSAGRTRAPALSLDEYAAFAAREFAREPLGRAVRGTVRLGGAARPARSAAWRGALAADPAEARALLALIEADLPALRQGGVRLVARHAVSRGEPVVLAAAAEASPARAPAARAVFGVVYARRATYGYAGEAVTREVPLLPPTFAGVDWRTARPVAAVRSDEARRPRVVSTPQMNAAHNRLLALRVTTPQGAVLYASSGVAAAVWQSSYAATFVETQSGVRVTAALPEAAGARLVAAAVPIAPERRLLAAVLLLGVAFAGAGAAGVRRTRQLARARAVFVASVSHELRTPLAHVSALSETMLLGRAESPEQADRWLRAIHREAQRLTGMVENVLLHARAERGRAASPARWADVAALAREVAHVVEPLASARQARVFVSGPPACWAWVADDALRQVLLNLLDNALKYGPSGQTVRVSVRTTARPAGGALEVRVDDQGPGVRAADRRRVWRPFVRLDDGDGGAGGTGLGLSVVRGLVEAQGGTVRVDDAPQRGARFTVTLPQAAAPGRPDSGLPDPTVARRA